MGGAEQERKTSSTGRPVILALERLGGGMPGISGAYGNSMAEAAAVCLHEQGHRSGVEMAVTGSYEGRFRLTWEPVTEQMIRTWADREFATETGAYGIAALIIEALTELTVIERSRKGTGFDYWLGPRASAVPLFQEKARLEVSGIRTGNAAYIRTRVRKKIKQTRVSDGAIPAFVIVVEFSGPRSEVVQR